LGVFARRGQLRVCPMQLALSTNKLQIDGIGR
jgi:hypothetical protein